MFSEYKNQTCVTISYLLGKKIKEIKLDKKYNTDKGK